MVADGIQAIMRKKGMYQKIVAERSGFTNQQFSDMLRGRKVIRADYLPRIAVALEVEVSELFSIKDAS